MSPCWYRGKSVDDGETGDKRPMPRLCEVRVVVPQKNLRKLQPPRRWKQKALSIVFWLVHFREARNAKVSLRGCKKRKNLHHKQLTMPHKEVSTGKRPGLFWFSLTLASEIRWEGLEMKTSLSIWQIKKISHNWTHENLGTECRGWVNTERHLNYMTKWDHSEEGQDSPGELKSFKDKQRRRSQQLGVKTTFRRVTLTCGRNPDKCGVSEA